MEKDEQSKLTIKQIRREFGCSDSKTKKLKLILTWTAYVTKQLSNKKRGTPWTLCELVPCENWPRVPSSFW